MQKRHGIIEQSFISHNFLRRTVRSKKNVFHETRGNRNIHLDGGRNVGQIPLFKSIYYIGIGFLNQSTFPGGIKSFISTTY
jgi:hypothetical protein